MVIHSFTKYKKTFQYTPHGDHILNAVQPVEMEKRPKVELALVEYVLLPLQMIFFKPIFAIKKIVSYIKRTIYDSLNNNLQRYTTFIVE